MWAVALSLSTYSSDNGTTWHAPVQVTTSFIRDVQITGDKVTGDVYIAGMDENSGNGCIPAAAPTETTRSTAPLTAVTPGPTPTPGPPLSALAAAASGFFCTMYSSPAYWRHMGWGEPAAYNHVVSLVYALKDGSDPGNVFLHSFHRQRRDLQCARPVELQHRSHQGAVACPTSRSAKLALSSPRGMTRHRGHLPAVSPPVPPIFVTRCIRTSRPITA